MDARARSSNIIIAVTAVVLALTGQTAPVTGTSASVWDRVAASVFVVRAALPSFPRECTGWFLAPLPQDRPAVSAYVTAGHCSEPYVVAESSGGPNAGLEQTVWRGRVLTPGSDAAIGLRRDPRTNRVFLPLAISAARLGDRALVIGWSGQRLAAAIVRFERISPNGLLEYTSHLALAPGLSGAPIVSLATGDVVGIVVGLSLADRNDSGASHVIYATPASAIRALAYLAVPNALMPADGEAKTY